MKTAPFIYIFILMVLSIVTFPLSAQLPILRFNAVSSGWPPFAFIDQKGQATGIFVDSLYLFLKDFPHSVEITNYPLLRAEKAMDNNQLDVMIRSKSWTKNPDNFYWSNPILQNRDIILSLLSAPIEFDSIDQLAGKKIGTIHGFSYPTMNHLFVQKKIERIDALNTSNSIQMLLHNHVQGIVISEAVARWMIRNESHLKGKFHFSKNHIDQNSVEYRFRKDTALLPIINALNRGMEQSKKNGQFNKLIGKYQ